MPRGHPNTPKFCVICNKQIPTQNDFTCSVKCNRIKALKWKEIPKVYGQSKL